MPKRRQIPWNVGSDEDQFLAQGVMLYGLAVGRPAATALLSYKYFNATDTGLTYQCRATTTGWAWTQTTPVPWPVAQGGTGVTSVTTAPTASAFAGWDTNKNLSANSFVDGYTTTATGAGTTTLTVGSTQQQFFSGSTTQTVLLPVTSTLVLGQAYVVVNNSSGNVTVQSSGGNNVQVQAAGTMGIYTCILLTGTTAASWSATYIVSGAGTGTVTSVTGASGIAGTVTTSGNLTFIGRGFIDGLILSYNSTTVLSIAAGQATDSTNATAIVGTAFTKSTAGAWASGSGSNGMGTGLTIANSTWYHVYAIINSGAYDVYFDTSASAANKPASTTAFRRIGSFLTDGSAHIIKFFQVGNRFTWDVALIDVSVSPGSTARQTATLTVPTGVKVFPSCAIQLRSVAATNVYVLFTTTDQTDTSPSSGLDCWIITNGGYEVVDFPLRPNIYTNTSGQIYWRFDTSGGTTFIGINTHGWTDLRGQDS